MTMIVGAGLAGMHVVHGLRTVPGMISAIGNWVHLVKLAFEKYFSYRISHGTSGPTYEKYVMKALGIGRLKPGTGSKS